MKTLVKAMSLIFFFAVVLSSCEKEPTNELENSIEQSASQKKNNAKDKYCWTCGGGTFKCEISCGYGGFSIKVHEWPDGSIKYTYHTRNKIYVDQAYHNSNWATQMNNIYKFKHFLLNNTATGPDVPWKDVNGNVIIGNVYEYEMKKNRYPCDTTFTTERLSNVPDPCSMNSALVHINNALSGAKNTCQDGMFAGGIFCPAPPPSSWTPLQSSPFEEPSVEYVFGKLCLVSQPGYCGPDTTNRDSNIFPVNDPNKGPVKFFIGQNQNELKLHFFRDLKSTQLIVDQPSEIIIPQKVKDYYNLSPDATLMYGTYPVVPTLYDHGYVVIPLN